MCACKKQELSLGFGNSWVFQQEHDPKHTSKVMKKSSNQARIREQSLQKFDRNPVVNMWTVLVNLACAGKLYLRSHYFEDNIFFNRFVDFFGSQD